MAIGYSVTGISCEAKSKGCLHCAEEGGEAHLDAIGFASRCSPANDPHKRVALCRIGRNEEKEDPVNFVVCTRFCLLLWQLGPLVFDWPEILPEECQKHSFEHTHPPR